VETKEACMTGIDILKELSGTFGWILAGVLSFLFGIGVLGNIQNTAGEILGGSFIVFGILCLLVFFLKSGTQTISQ